MKAKFTLALNVSPFEISTAAQIFMFGVIT